MSSSLLRPIKMAFQILLLFPRILVYYSLRLRNLTEEYQSYRSTDSENLKDMDVEQRYTEEANFDFSEIAFDKMLALNSVGYHLSMSIQKNSHKFSVSNGIVQEYTVMTSTTGSIDVPFKLMVLSQDGDVPILVDFHKINIDQYLDSIIKNKSITHERAINNNTAISKEGD
jgi:DNA-directed RNA polymerase